MDLRRLTLLREFARLGSMRAVADELGYTTSTVSQQLSVLAREAGTTLIEPTGRRVRLTPAGERLAGHATTILAAVDAAKADLDPSGHPAGTVCVAGFASAIRRLLLPVIARVSAEHPDIHVRLNEHEPVEAVELLIADRVDLALLYDYDVAPETWDPLFVVTPLWTSSFGLGVPAADAADGLDAADVFARFASSDWIVNSRNAADEHVVRLLASLAGFEPRIAHRADSLELVQDLIVGGLGVGLLPDAMPLINGVARVSLLRPGVNLRAYLAVRRGRENWPPLRVITSLLT